uniref:Alpha-L-rhamnosidase n=1 Tax=mine drainage metagenome TaxID=410659 RepID=E6QMR4_9ZZZZ
MAYWRGFRAPDKRLESSNDGITFRLVADLNGSKFPEHTTSFPPATARFFRIVIQRVPAPEDSEAARNPSGDDYEIEEVALHPGARVNRFEDKAAFTSAPDLYGYASPTVGPDQAIAKSDVIDLTAKMHPDGSLDWTPPAGHWVVLRFGYSLLGITNHPATAEATGLEVDKLNHQYVKNYMEKYLQSYKDTVGPDWMGKRGIRYVINDSWEAGSQNWTDDMIQQFRKRRGYDPTPWLPVLTGHIVESAAASDQFLWDFRKTIADLIANEHYGQLEATLHQWGMGHYGESHEGGRAFVADGMEVKKFNEVPMGAMWTQTPGVNHIQYGFNADDRESASVAHIYGQNLAAAESMTAAAAPFAWYPAALKPTADQEFLNGINRIVIHESAHQPLIDKKPGLTLGPFGQWFNRNETWADQAGAWVDYLARTSYLLQQGRFGADLLYFYGEDSNLTAIFENKSPDVPAGYGFDYVNADALIHVLGVENGQITTPGLVRYRLLGLDPYSRHMSLPVLRAIDKLVEQGAVVAGPKPIDDPSLADDHAEFQRLSDQLFGPGTGIGSGVHSVGKGKVYAGQTPAEAFRAMAVAPDFDYAANSPETHLEFLHRRLPGADIYFVDNRGDHDADVKATFRVAGMQPKLWYADSGRVEPVSFTVSNGRTETPLHLEPWGTVFVVFREPTQLTSYTAPAHAVTALTTLSGSWQVTFPANWGAPPSVTLPSLSSWSDNSDPGVKYFSGTGTYTKTLTVPANWFAAKTRLWIDLGEVKNLAEVEVNGKPLGVVWHAPYRVDATSALKPGENQITLHVTNAWVNRMIGDQQPNATKFAFTDVEPYHANSPLLPSGLLGPVRLLADKEQ